MELQIDDVTITFQVMYGRGKKIKLLGTTEGHLTLHVPNKTTEDQILAYMNRIKPQLLKFHRQSQNKHHIRATKLYQADELHLVLGQPTHLQDILGTNLHETIDISLALKQFYTKKTREIIKSRVSHYEKIIGVKARTVTIVHTNQTWGTCNHNRDLTFNYKLSMAPLSVIDYVVIHELTHIHHLNHDRSFWRKLGSYDPNYKEHEAYLRHYGPYMTI